MFEVVSPVTEEVIAEVEALDELATSQAIEKAHEGFLYWRALPPGKRAELLRRFAGKVEQNIEELALLEVRNSGHTIGNARWEANNVKDVLHYYAGAVERLTGLQIPVPGGVDMTFKEPVGVVGVIVPWNFPMPIAGWGFAPALAAGCSVVLKPAEITPLTAMKIAELAYEAGVPEHVFQVLTGSGRVVGETIVTHPLVKKVVFTGSTEVGVRIQTLAAPQIKPVTLELGGKSANIVFEDCDLEKAASSAPYSVFDNAGQDCCARSRLLVQDSVFDEFMDIFEKAVKAVKVEDPFLDTSEMGPLISLSHRERVDSYVKESDVLFRGSCPTGKGYWYPPTVLRTDDPKVLKEEIFGPVVAVQTFRSEEEAIALANDSEYGLSGSIWTSNLGRGLRVSQAVESGNLSVNSHSSVRYWTPFGGYKRSGLGRELGPNATDAFCEIKNVFISTEI
ncbi:Acyl-CoA reductase [Ferrithrix thermotolerans DSM 19514]|jgi:acyl-CoA reductase-like NAD-dependent aldehyde dehydrogenase|uniref:Acyl-CoA reductase n=1 Tax=Ferrithrix thermotolerans DSM 19514 TaxID=1121881 RepID=A0A1M4SBU1_9ACTN|nr:aldehyde dehydrogenase family protein [Ferrithrix thermotolerans]SHE29517.1 Acyl-CoA reductase [Ferrithrix thermotolerans DSM 19514]